MTSDCHLCPLPAGIFSCLDCGHIQKLHSAAEKTRVSELYHHYQIYHLAGGREQLVYPADAPPRPRSYHVLERCLPALPKKGRLLDVGTGNGAVLRSAAQLLPEWRLSAFDVDAAGREEVLKIPHVQDFFVGDIREIPSENVFDLVVLWHSLEHAARPAGLLGQIRERLGPNGRLLVQVPDLERAPFDLAVIDHCSHFTKKGLLGLCAALDFSVETDGHGWTHNCLTLLLKKEDSNTSKPKPQKCPAGARVFKWVGDAVRYFEGSVKNKTFAIFGSSIAGLWVSSQLGSKPKAFIDMDAQAIGNFLEEVPVLGPESLRPSERVIMPFARASAEAISGKVKDLYPACRSVDFILSPYPPD